LILIDLVRRRPIDYGQDAAHWTFKLFNYERQRGPVVRWGQSATGTICLICRTLCILLV